MFPSKIKYDIDIASPADAPLIAEAIIAAITPQTCIESFGQVDPSIDDIKSVFEKMAARDDSQYSWKNCAIARTRETGEPMGLAVFYDGAKLKKLRQAFVKEASKSLGWIAPDPFPDETDDEEVYLDTLYVSPQWRRQGVGKALIDYVSQKACEDYGKPVGLLVAKGNDKARRLYESSGFVCVGDRLFFDEPMDHMIRNYKQCLS